MEDIDFAKLAQHFGDEDKASELLEGIRWPDGPVCPHCDGDVVYKLEAKPASKRPVRKGVYKCKACQKQFTVTVGTVMEGSKIPLHKWLMAIYLMCASKKGISAHQLHRMLEITYKSAWFMVHRIRHAMTQGPILEKMSGIVKADETYVGGKQHNKHQVKRDVNGRGRSTESKTPVACLVERGGQLRARKVERVGAAELKGYIREHVDTQASAPWLKYLFGFDAKAKIGYDVPIL